MILKTKDALINTYYGDKKLYLIFSLLYKNINFEPAYEGNLPSVDHILPQSALKKNKVLSSETGRKVIKYKRWDRDQLANLMILSLTENRDEKRVTLPEEWFKDKDDEYLKIHLIPNNSQLLKLENYKKFIEERKKMIIERFKDMALIQTESQNKKSLDA